MRFPKGSATALLVFVLLFGLGSLQAGTPQQIINGRIVNENFEQACESQCIVTLLSAGRPLQSVVADLAGNFAFSAVPSGAYSVRIEVGGVEVATQAVDANMPSARVTVMLPISVNTNGAAPAVKSNTVNVAEFLGQYPKKAVSYFEKGRDLVKKRKYDEAVKYLRSAVEIAPTFYQAHNELGIAYRETGKRAEAEQEFMRAHELNAMGVEPLLNLSTLYIEENDAKRAIETSEQAVKINARSGPAFFSLGVALYKTAQLDRAESALKRALDLAPRMADIRLMLANVYIKLHRYDSSVEQLNRYMAENPKSPQLPEVTAMRDRLVEASTTQQP